MDSNLAPAGPPDKAASDVAAYARSLAQARQRNVSLADEAVMKSRSFTDREAVEAFSKGIPLQPAYAFVYWRRGLAYSRRPRTMRSHDCAIPPREGG